MLRIIGLVIAVLLLSTPVLAQAPTGVASWTYDRAPTEVATYTQAVTFDAAVITAVPQCVPAPSGSPAGVLTVCSVPLGTIQPGSHVLSIAATRNGMTAETRLTGIDMAGAPGNAQNPRINLTLTITVQ